MTSRIRSVFAPLAVLVATLGTASTSEAGFTFDLAKACVAKGGQVKTKASTQLNLPLPNGRACDFTAAAKACPGGQFDMSTLSCAPSVGKQCLDAGGAYHPAGSIDYRCSGEQCATRFSDGSLCDFDHLEYECGNLGATFVRATLDAQGFTPAQCVPAAANEPLRAACEAQGGQWSNTVQFTAPTPERFVVSYPSGTCDLTAPAKRCNQESTLSFGPAGLPTGFGCISVPQIASGGGVPWGTWNGFGNGSSCDIAGPACDFDSGGTVKPVIVNVVQYNP